MRSYLTLAVHQIVARFEDAVNGMSERIELADEWRWVYLEEIAHLHHGAASSDAMAGDAVQVMSASDPPADKTMVAEGPSAANPDLTTVAPTCQVDLTFLVYCLTGAGEKCCDKDGIAVPKVTITATEEKKSGRRDGKSEGLRRVKVFLPPIEYQKALVAKIREDFCNRDSDAYRSGVLKALAEGEVRLDWFEKSGTADAEVCQPALKDLKQLLRQVASEERKYLTEKFAEMHGDVKKLLEMPRTASQPKSGTGSEWPIEVNIETKAVTVRGKEHFLANDYDVRIVAALNNAKGHPVSRSKMQKMDSLLAEDTHLERRIKEIPKKYAFLKYAVRRYSDFKNSPFCLDVTKLA